MSTKLTRCADIAPVKVKSVEQQAMPGLHGIRSLWMSTRTSRINALRGFCRELGIVIAQGSRVGVEQISRVLADPHSAVPTGLASQDPPVHSCYPIVRSSKTIVYTTLIANLAFATGPFG